MVIKVSSLSKNIVDIMTTLSKNDGLAKLLLSNDDNPFQSNEEGGKHLINQKGEKCRIFPYPFDPEAKTTDSSFLRVYYNRGEFDSSEVIQEMNLHIDIVVAKSLWLINSNTDSMIRPYEIMDRVVDLLGKRSLNNSIKLKIDGWNHLAVNAKFDAIRLYSDYFSVETSHNSYANEKY